MSKTIEFTEEELQLINNDIEVGKLKLDMMISPDDCSWDLSEREQIIDAIRAREDIIKKVTK